jgi:hypothetical protein
VVYQTSLHTHLLLLQQMRLVQAQEARQVTVRHPPLQIKLRIQPLAHIHSLPLLDSTQQQFLLFALVVVAAVTGLALATQIILALAVVVAVLGT